MPQTSLMDVTAFIDERRMSFLQWRGFILCALVNILDGADSQSIGVAGPLIAHGMHMRMSDFTPVFSAGLLGAAIGALSFGSLADRFGRKQMLVVATILFAAFTLLTPVAPDFSLLLIVRFLAGLGLGGATPCFITLVADYVPKPWRATLTAVLWAAYPLGASIGGFLNAYLIPTLGWRSIFHVGGISAIVVGILLILLLPESLSYLASRAPNAQRAKAIIRAIDPAIAVDGIILSKRAEDSSTSRGALKSLFDAGRTPRTLLLWGMFFTAFGSTTIGVLLMPTLFRMSGLPLSVSAMLVGLFDLVAIASMACAGRLLSWLGVGVIAAAFICGAGALVFLGYSCSTLPMAVIGMALLGLTVPLAGSAVIALAAIIYPATIRSTGVGWAMGMGRLGQVFTPLWLGALLGFGWDAKSILIAITAIPLVGGACGLIWLAIGQRGNTAA